MQLRGAKVLVTGASSGIGAALARQLSSLGATVALAARRADRLAAVAAECRGSVVFTVDLSVPEAGERLISDAWDALDGLDALVNNAALDKRKLVGDHDAHDIESVMNTNFVTPVRMAIAVLPRMLARGSGTILNVGSGGGRFGIAHESVYCASKFALTGWTEVAAADLAGTPIDVKLVQPGAVATEMWEQRPGELAGMPGGDFITAAECATGICDALESEGFEFFVPSGLADVVGWKNSDVTGWIAMMSSLGVETAP